MREPEQVKERLRDLIRDTRQDLSALQMSADMVRRHYELQARLLALVEALAIVKAASGERLPEIHKNEEWYV